MLYLLNELFTRVVLASPWSCYRFQGETIVYSRTGMHLMSGSSSLPGGGTSKRQGLNFTVLDCVFDQRRRTFHLLDVIFWNGTSLAENTVMNGAFTPM